MDVADIESVLEGMPLPARPDEIVAHAEIEGADEDLLTSLRALEDQEYESLEEVREALRAVQA
jgi:hypothetical protein